MTLGVENDLDNFIFDPTEISLQDYLEEWRSKVQDVKTAAPHISDGKLGFKLLKNLDFPKRKIDFILEHINVQECIKQGTFVHELLTVISTLSSQDWKSTCNKAKPRFEITDGGTRSVNILEYSHFVFLKLLMNYLGFEDKKNLCLVSKRMYLRTNKLAPEIGTWRIKLTDANYRYYASKLRTSPYAEAQKNIDLDVKEYSGSAKEMKNLVKDRVTSITGTNIKIVKTFVKTENTWENIKSLSFNGISSEDKLSMIEFLNCSEITPRQLKFTNCDIDRKVMELGFETFNCLEELVVHEDKMKSTSLRILLRKSSKTLRSLEIAEPKFKPFNVLVLKNLKFPNLRTVVLDLENSPVSCYEVMKCLSVNVKSLETLKVTNTKDDKRDSNLPVISFPAMKQFTYWSDFRKVDSLDKCLYYMPLLTKLDLNAIKTDSLFLPHVLDSYQHLQRLSLMNVTFFGDLHLPTRTHLQLKSLTLANNRRIFVEGVANFDERSVVPAPEPKKGVFNVRKVNISPLINHLLQRSANSLQYLSLYEEELDQVDLNTSFSNLIYLRVLCDLDRSEDSFGPASIVMIGLLNKCYRTLEFLQLDNWKKLNMSHLVQNLDNFPNLEMIVLKECKEVFNLSKFCNTAAQSLESLILLESYANDVGEVRLPKLRTLNLDAEDECAMKYKWIDVTDLLKSCSSSLQTLSLFRGAKVSTNFEKGLVFPKLKSVALGVGNPSVLLSKCSTSLKVLTFPNVTENLIQKSIPWKLLNLSHLFISPRPSPEDLSYLRRQVSSDCIIDSDFLRMVNYLKQFSNYKDMRQIS